MDKMLATVYASVVFAMIGLFLVASGLNGLIVLGPDNYTTPLCENNKDCSGYETCCLFENKTAGACMSKETCKQFLAMPQKTTEPPTELVPPSNVPQIVQLVSGIIIVLLTGFMLYYTNKSELNKKSKHI